MNWRSKAKNYFKTSTIHGFHYIVDEELHWTERFFWIICCTLSLAASVQLILESLEIYRRNAISFAIDTDYLHWNTNFPSISVCEVENPITISKYADRVYGKERDYSIDEVIAEIAFFQGTTYFLLEYCQMGGAACVKDNFSEVAAEVRSPCPVLLSQCIWNKTLEFDCCEFFKPQPTELGLCYTLNVKYLNILNISRYSNSLIGLANLMISSNTKVDVYLHAENEVPFFNLEMSDSLTSTLNTHIKYFISVKDVENVRELKLLSSSQRQCHYQMEDSLDENNTYSYSSCFVDCRMQNQLNLCNCTSHFMPGSDPKQHCDLDGLICLGNHYLDLVSIEKSLNQKSDSVNCFCQQACEELDIDEISQERSLHMENITVMEIILHHLPSEMFRRNVVRNQISVIANLGGAISLFVGASILSFLEILYHFTLRLIPYTTNGFKR